MLSRLHIITRRYPSWSIRTSFWTIARFQFSSFSSGPDPFRILGLNRQCSSAEVRDRYYKLAKQLHPDTATEKQSDELLRANREKFTMVTEAFKQAYAYASAGTESIEDETYRKGKSYVDMESIVHEMEQFYSMDWNGQEIQSSGPDWGGYWWMTQFQNAENSNDNGNNGGNKR